MTKEELQGYETVDTRKKKFYEKFPDARILTECLTADGMTALFKCTLFKNKEEQSAGVPLATGHAQEFKGQGGFANKFSWTENCETSAVGRALANAGFSGNGSCSYEEMLKVERHTTLESPSLPLNSPVAANTGSSDVVVPFGPNKGLKVSAMRTEDLINDLNYWNNRLAKEGKKPTGQLAKYLEAVSQALSQQEQSEPDDIVF